MAIVRLGTCGIVKKDINVGTIIVPDSSVLVQQNFFGFSPDPFLISPPCKGCNDLISLVGKDIRAKAGTAFTVDEGGLDASTDSFYCSQGRPSEAFDQDCSALISTLESKFPTHKIFEMETFLL